MKLLNIILIYYMDMDILLNFSIGTMPYILKMPQECLY
nr:MAG TPA: hypothetical protein [Crassvirales sp.]